MIREGIHEKVHVLKIITQNNITMYRHTCLTIDGRKCSHFLANYN